MKKIIAILLAMAIGLSLAACGSTPAQPSQPAAEASSTDAAPAESASAAEGKAEYAVVLKVLSSQMCIRDRCTAVSIKRCGGNPVLLHEKRDAARHPVSNPIYRFCWGGRRRLAW